MKNKKMIFIAIAVILVGVGVWWFYFKDKQPANMADPGLVGGAAPSSVPSSYIEAQDLYGAELAKLIQRTRPGEVDSVVKQKNISKEEAALGVANWYIWKAYETAEKSGKTPTLSEAGKKFF